MRIAQVEDQRSGGKRLVQVPNTAEDMRAAEAQPGFVVWADQDTARIPLTSGSSALVPGSQADAARADPLAAPSLRGDEQRFALSGGRSALVPKADVPVALRSPESTGGSAMRALVDGPALPEATPGAWNPEADWAHGGAALRAIQAEPRTSAPQSLSGAEDPEDARREALLDLERRTRVPAAPAPKDTPSHPRVNVSTVDSTGAPRPFQDLASLAPAVTGVTGGDVPTRTASARPAASGAPSAPIADGLSREQLFATLSRLGNGISSGGARIAEAISGAKPTPGAYDNTAAEQRVKDYMLRQNVAQDEAERAKKAALEAALKDPFSAESMRFKAALQRTLPGIYGEKDLATMTAADAPMVTDFAKMRATLDARAKEAEAERKSREGIAEDNRAARLEEAHQRLLDRALSRDLAMQQHKDAQSLKEEGKQQDFERKMSERNVGGYEIDPNSPPTAEGAKNMANVVRHKDEILGSLDRLENMIKENGSEMFGTKAGEMASEWMNISNRLRGLNEMGVPNGKDYQMLAKQLVDPTSWEATTTSTARMLQQIKSLRSQMERTTEATAKAYKYKPSGGSGGTVSAPQAGVAPRRKKDEQGQVWEEQPDGSARLVL